MKILVIGFMLAFSSTAFAKERVGGKTVGSDDKVQCCKGNICKVCDDTKGVSCGSASSAGQACRMDIGGAIIQGTVKSKTSAVSDLGTLKSGK